MYMLLQWTVKKGAWLLHKVREERELNTAAKRIRIKGPECHEEFRFNLGGYVEP